MMDDERRKLFQSNEIWYNCLSPFFCLVQNIMVSEKGRIAISSLYQSLLTFIAQASCWRVSRDDIVTDAMWLKLEHFVSYGCLDAQRALSLVLDMSELMGPLNLIAATPLCNEDPRCNVSVIVGLIRMMSNDKQKDTHFLECIIDILVVNDKVDGQVITELIKYGGRDDSTANFVLRMMLVTLGLDDENKDIQKSDSNLQWPFRVAY